MYGHLAAAPLPASDMLVDERHSIMAQSRLDWRSETHGDGWGIGYFEGTAARIIRQPTAAFEDPEFAAAARRIVSPALIGHVRQASVGNLSEANTHPFGCGRWIFGHNGTVTGFDQLVGQLLDETDDDLRRHIAGTTDSEHVFFWLLSRLRAAGEAAEGPDTSVETVARVVAEGVRTLEERSAATGVELPARLNFLLTDGAVMVASRFRHSLYWTVRHGPFAAAGAPRGVAVSSEPIGREAWAEVPESAVLMVDRDMLVRWVAI